LAPASSPLGGDSGRRPPSTAASPLQPSSPLCSCRSGASEARVPTGKAAVGLLSPATMGTSNDVLALGIAEYPSCVWWLVAGSGTSGRTRTPGEQSPSLSSNPSPSSLIVPTGSVVPGALRPASRSRSRISVSFNRGEQFVQSRALWLYLPLFICVNFAGRFLGYT